MVPGRKGVRDGFAENADRLRRVSAGACPGSCVLSPANSAQPSLPRPLPAAANSQPEVEESRGSESHCNRCWRTSPAAAEGGRVGLASSRRGVRTAVRTTPAQAREARAPAREPGVYAVGSRGGTSCPENHAMSSAVRSNLCVSTRDGRTLWVESRRRPVDKQLPAQLRSAVAGEQRVTAARLPPALAPAIASLQGSRPSSPMCSAVHSRAA